MRIIGGRWRGRKLPVPDVPGLRPTPDRVRETLFNWLAPNIAGLRCLDLFAGSGALGFEALSRGAGELLMLETDARALAALRESAGLLGAEPEIRRADALAALARPPPRGFDLVFVDPPFEAGLWDAVLRQLPAWLRPGHRVYVESDAHWTGPADPAWQELKQKRAADVVFRLLHYSGSLTPAQGGENP